MPTAAPPRLAPSSEWYYAGFWWRVMALYIDNLILQAAIGAIVQVSPLHDRVMAAAKLANGPPGQNKVANADQAIEQFKTAMEKTFALVVADPLLVVMFVILVGASYLAIWLYRALLESSPAQATLGKQACRIKVTDLEGNRISFARATCRCFARFGVGAVFGAGLWAYFYCSHVNADTLFTLKFWVITATAALAADVPYFLAGWTPRKQALHDMIAGTLVFRRRPPSGSVPPPQLI
jgi:uncharacterized RDD family membrane protein YckC